MLKFLVKINMKSFYLVTAAFSRYEKINIFKNFLIKKFTKNIKKNTLQQFMNILDRWKSGNACLLCYNAKTIIRQQPLS